MSAEAEGHPPSRAEAVAFINATVLYILSRGEGEVDCATAPLLSQALAQVSAHRTGPVVLDAAMLDFIDAHSLGVIANTRTLLGEQGRDLSV